jgi:hypothetical protein
MAGERSLITVERAYHASQRFDYFVLGITLAVCAYAGQTISPQKFWSVPYAIEVASVISLIGSAFCGFRHLEKKIRMDGLNHRILDAHEKIGKIVHHQVVRGDEEQFINEGTGDIWSGADLIKEKDEIEKALSKFYTEINRVFTESQRLYNWRNGLLAGGFTGLFFAKIISPYFC